MSSQPAHENNIPYISACFTNWKPKKMADVVSFCMKHDPNKPNFL